MAPSRIVELSCIIHEQTAKVDAYLDSQKLPSPSFDTSYPAKVPLPPNIQASQDVVLDATDELTALMLGPAGFFTRYPHSAWASLQAIQRFGIANSFPPGSSSTFGDIARACSLPESDTRRILRAAMTYYIFREPTPGSVVHTAASKLLGQVPLLGQLVGFLAGEMWPSSTRMVDAMEKWPGSEEPNEAGFALAYGTDIPMFDVVGREAKRAQRMAGAMTFMHSGPSYSVRHTLEHFDWGTASQGVLVDIGGGTGGVAIEIARYFPRIKCIVQDLPEVIEGAEIPEDLQVGERVRLMSHNFFELQPVKGADIYHLRWVLHDWSDKYAVKILSSLIPALKKGSRILVSELCLPSPCILSPYKERSARNFDLSMKEIQNAKERDCDDWEQLFRETDSRFLFQGVKTPAGSTLSIISAEWQGEMA